MHMKEKNVIRNIKDRQNETTCVDTDDRVNFCCTSNHINNEDALSNTRKDYFLKTGSFFFNFFYKKIVIILLLSFV